MRKKIQIERLDDDSYLVTDWPILSSRLRSCLTLGELLKVVLDVIVPETVPHEARGEIIEEVVVLVDDLWRSKVKRIRRV